MLWDSCWYLVDRHSVADPDHLQMASQNVWNMSLFERFFKVFSLYLESRIGSGFASKWKVGPGSESASNWQAVSGSALKWESGSGAASKLCGTATLDRNIEIYTFLLNFYLSFYVCSVNGVKTNQLKPVWLMDPKEVDTELHNDFYRDILHSRLQRDLGLVLRWKSQR